MDKLTIHTEVKEEKVKRQTRIGTAPPFLFSFAEIEIRTEKISVRISLF